MTGWAIDSGNPAETGDRSRDARALDDKLGQVVIPQFYRDRERFQNVMRQAIAINGSFFNTHRMLHEYAVKAYFC